MTYTVEIPDGSSTDKTFKVLMKALNISFKKTKEKKEKPYNPEYVAMIEEGRQQIREGKTFTVTLEDLWK